MRLFRLATIVGLGLVLVSGCGQKNKLYEGLPLDVWTGRLQSTDPEIRADALNVIIEAGAGALKAEPLVRSIARGDPHMDIRVKAVTALDSMHVPTSEFQDLVSRANEPLVETEGGEPEFPSDDEEGNVQMDDRVVVDDDIEALRNLAAQNSDSMQAESSMVPMSDSAAFEDWKEQKRNSGMDDLMTQMRDPRVLARLAIIGEAVERRFAARTLADQEGSDPDVIDALIRASSDPDTLVRIAAKEALKHWHLQ